MNKIILSVLIVGQCLLLNAQGRAPRWMSKSREAVVTVTTYDKDNRKLHSGIGFFVSEKGDVLSAYTLFKDAARAEVTDVNGKTYPVSRIGGANEMYDVIRFQADIPKTVTSLPLSPEPVAVGADVYLMLFSSGRNQVFKTGKILEVTNLGASYNYYKVSFPLTSEEVNAPLLSSTGEVFGLAQEGAAGENEGSYAISAGYVNSLSFSSTDMFSDTYNVIGIKKAWPNTLEQAIIMLFLERGRQQPEVYIETLNDFIATFPSSPDGYLTRASYYAANREILSSSGISEAQYLIKALEDISTAAQYSEKKGDAYYNRAKLIFEQVASDSTFTHPGWTLEASLQAIEQAIAEEDIPVYRQLQGDIYFYLRMYEQSFDSYMRVNASNLASPESYYMAAKAKENTTGFNISEIISLLDNAIIRSGTPPTRAVSPYILERIEWKTMMMMHDEAVADYDLYYKVMNGEVGAAFYYYREQAKFKAGDFTGALADIQQALSMNVLPDYLAEEASIYIRLEDYPHALESLDKALAIAPDFAACYRLKGICLVRQGKKNEACDAFNKAKELGDPVVDRLIREHCQ